MSAPGGSGPDQEVIEAAQELGSFRVGELATVTGLADEVVNTVLAAHPGLVEPDPGRPGRWRVVTKGAAHSAPAPPDPAAVTALGDAVEAALREIAKGGVLDPGQREHRLNVADERVSLAQREARRSGEAGLEARLARLERQLAQLRAIGQAGHGEFLHALQDWTCELPAPAGPHPAGAFDLDRIVRAAKQSAAHPDAIFRPARAALAAGLAGSDGLPTIIAAVDKAIRLAAIQGRVFEVLAHGCVGAVVQQGQLADAMVAALTSPAFRDAIDRTALRIGYAMLASLARPGTADASRAVEACTYLLRREPPGRDEMELLAPAALQAKAADPEADFTLIAQWLKWEAERDPADYGDGGTALQRLGHFARNLGCSLDLAGFEPLKRGLRRLQEDELGVVLVRHVGDVQNRAIEIRPARRAAGVDALFDGPDEDYSGTFNALARDDVARQTATARQGRGPVEVPLRSGTLVAHAIEYLASQPREPSRFKFTESRRAWARRHG